MAQPILESSYEQTLWRPRSFQTLNYVYALERYEEAYEDKEDRALIDTIAWLNFQIAITGSGALVRPHPAPGGGGRAHRIPLHLRAVAQDEREVR